MRLIKILVEDNDRAMQIGAVLGEAEEDGKLDFPFTMRITDDLSAAKASYNLFHEEEVSE